MSKTKRVCNAVISKNSALPIEDYAQVIYTDRIDELNLEIWWLEEP